MIFRSRLYRTRKPGFCGFVNLITIPLKAVLTAACIAIFCFAGPGEIRGQGDQKSAASKTAKFEIISKTDPLYTSAIDAHDLSAANDKIGKEAAFRGTVSKVFESNKGGLLILNFDPDYKTALTAVLRRADFSKFPEMNLLLGKEIVVRGKFIDYQGRAEIVLTDAAQILIVE